MCGRPFPDRVPPVRTIDVDAIALPPREPGRLGLRPDETGDPVTTNGGDITLIQGTTEQRMSRCATSRNLLMCSGVLVVGLLTHCATRSATEGASTPEDAVAGYNAAVHVAVERLAAALVSEEEIFRQRVALVPRERRVLVASRALLRP